MATEGTGAHCARDLGRGWKISPSVVIPSATSFELANITGPGAIQQMAHAHRQLEALDPTLLLGRRSDAEH